MEDDNNGVRDDFTAALLGDVKARNAAADAKLDRKFRSRRMKREDSEEERQFKARRRSERRSSFRVGCASVVRAAIIGFPIVAPMTIAWTGQASFAVKNFGWSMQAGLLYAAAYEMTTIFCAWMYDQARKDGDKGLEYRIATWTFAAGAAGQQWWHYLEPNGSPGYKSVTFATMTLIGVTLWELFARLNHRRKLRRDGKLPEARPRFGAIRWLRYPRVTFDAWSLTVRQSSKFNTVDLAWSEAEKAAIQRDRARIARRILQIQAGPHRVRAGSGVARRGLARFVPGKAQVWAVPGQVYADQGALTVGSGTDPAQIRTDPHEICAGSAQASAGSGLVGPGSEQVRTTDDGISPGTSTGPDRPGASQPGSGSGTDYNSTNDDGGEFEPIELERQAVALLIRTGRSISRTNCADAVRELEGGISTKRASELAKWGRDQHTRAGLRAV